MSNNQDKIPEEIKIWFLAESRKEPTTEAYKEWKRRGQQLCFEVAYTQGYQDASEAMYRRLSQQQGPRKKHIMHFVRWLAWNSIVPRSNLDHPTYIYDQYTKDHPDESPRTREEKEEWTRLVDAWPNLNDENLVFRNRFTKQLCGEYIGGNHETKQLYFGEGKNRQDVDFYNLEYRYSPKVDREKESLEEMLRWIFKNAPPEFREEKPFSLKGFRHKQSGNLISYGEVANLFLLQSQNK